MTINGNINIGIILNNPNTEVALFMFVIIQSLKALCVDRQFTVLGPFVQN